MKKLLLFIFIIASFSISAQNWRKFYNEIYELDSVSTNADANKKIFLETDFYSFFKNNEYFNDFKDGQTFIGFNNTTKIKYIASENLQVSGGFHYYSFFGEKSLKPLSPYFRIDYKLSKNLNLIFGALDGNHKHKLIEPLYSFDNYMSNFLENGIQLKFENNYFWSDNFINWISYIEQNSPFQEEILFGSSNEIKVMDKEYSISFPIQFLAYHRGGQINNVDTFMHSSVNANFGIKLKKSLNNKQNQLFFSFNYLLFNDISPKNSLGIKSGNAINLASGIELKNYYLEFSYFKGNNFYSQFGEQLYHSISFKNPNYIENNRELLNSKLMLNILSDEYLRILISAMLYYDLKNKTIDHSLSLNFVYNFKYQISKTKI